MEIPQVKEQYIMVSDDVRIEGNGKLIVIGLYGSSLVFPSLPAELGRLAFTLCYEVVTPGEDSLRHEIVRLDDGKRIINVQSPYKADRVGCQFSTYNIGPIIFEKPGTYLYVAHFLQSHTQMSTVLNVSQVE